MFAQGVAHSAFDTLPRQNSTRPESAPRRSDTSSVSDAPVHRSPVDSDDGATRSRRQFAGSALSVGNLLYLASVGLVATAIIGVFFGAGFLLLGPPAGGTPSGSIARNSGPEIRSLVYGLSPVSESDHQPANGRPGPVATKTPLPVSGDQTPSAVIPLPPRPAADERPPRERNETVQNSAELPATTPPSPPISAKDTPPEVAQAGSPAEKAVHRAPPEFAAALSPTPSSLAAASPDTPNAILSTAEVTELLARGDALLRTGDIASARLFYERAAAVGDGRAALRLGATFDPAFLGNAGLRNAQGDAAKARSWYSRALDLGAAEAKRQLNSLETETKHGR
jgi:hypothetical protein